MLKLFRVTCWYGDFKPDTFENIVIAGNIIEAKRIVEEEVWSLNGMKIKHVEEINMFLPQLLCSYDSEDM